MDYSKLILKKYKIKITSNTKNGYILGNYISNYYRWLIDCYAYLLFLPKKEKPQAR